MFIAGVYSSSRDSTALLGSARPCVQFTGSSLYRSASTDRLVVPSFNLSTIGSRTFEVDAAQTWNSLPEDVTSSSTLPIFRKRLKTDLFRQSYPNIDP